MQYEIWWKRVFWVSFPFRFFFFFFLSNFGGKVKSSPIDQYEQQESFGEEGVTIRQRLEEAGPCWRIRSGSGLLEYDPFFFFVSITHVSFWIITFRFLWSSTWNWNSWCYIYLSKPVTIIKERKLLLCMDTSIHSHVYVILPCS